MNNLTLNLTSKYNPYFCSNSDEQNNYNVNEASKFWLREQPQKTTINQTPTTQQTITEKPFFNSFEPDTATNAAGTAVFLRLAQRGIEWLSEMCASILMRGKEFASESDVKKVADAMKSEKGLKADIHYIDNTNKGFLKRMFPGLAKSIDTVANGGNAFYTHQGNFAVAPKSKPSLILHELGHATNFEKSKFFRGLQKLKVLGMYAPMAIAFLNDFSGKRKDGKQSFIEKYAGVIGFSAFLPTIVEEAAASIRGIKAARKTLPNVKLGALKRNYLLAWMTYVLAGVGIGLASKLAITEINIEKSNRNNKQNASIKTA